MPAKSRLFLALASCLLLSNCGLIGTALRLAPYYLLFAEKDGKGDGTEMRGREVQEKGRRGIIPTDGGAASQVAFRR